MPKGKQIYAYFGTDEARIKEEALKRSRELTPPDNVEFGLEVISGNADNSDHAAAIIADTIAALQTLPFFGGDKTVWLQGANFLGDTMSGRPVGAAAVRAVEQLTAVIDAGLPPGVCLVISGTAVDKRRTFYKKLGSMGEVTHLDLPDPSRPGWEQDVMSLAKKNARLLNFAFEPDALEHFVMATGENTLQMQAELEKLSVYLGERRVATVDDVREIVATTRAGVIFEIGDAIAARNLPRTIELIDYQLRRGENALGLLLAAIIPRVRSLMLARDLAENHRISPSSGYPAYQKAVERLPASATSHLPRKKDGGISVYPVFLAAKECGKFTLAELVKGLRACLDANRRLVTSQLEPEIVLSQLVTQLLTRQPAPSH